MFGCIVLLAACTASETPAPPTAPNRLAPVARPETSASVLKQLASLRRVTARFHDIGTAQKAGWSAQITGCMVSDSGGMASITETSGSSTAP